MYCIYTCTCDSSSGDPRFVLAASGTVQERWQTCSRDPERGHLFLHIYRHGHVRTDQSGCAVCPGKNFTGFFSELRYSKWRVNFGWCKSVMYIIFNALCRGISAERRTVAYVYMIECWNSTGKAKSQSRSFIISLFFPTNSVVCCGGDLWYGDPWPKLSSSASKITWSTSRCERGSRKRLHCHNRGEENIPLPTYHQIFLVTFHSAYMIC